MSQINGNPVTDIMAREDLSKTFTRKVRSLGEFDRNALNVQLNWILLETISRNVKGLIEICPVQTV